MERRPQNLANHAKYDPFFHFFLSPLLMVLLIVAGRAAIVEGTSDAWWRFGAALALFGIGAKTRLYALKVQDRVIRLEERLRLARVLGDQLPASRLAELTEGQLVALRFASDAELPGLVEKALAGAKPKEIKELIQKWRPDYFRV